MDVRLSVEANEPEKQCSDLLKWLRREPELRGLVTPVAAKPRAGDLGTALDLITVAVGSGGAVSVLAGSLKVFLAQPRRADVRITVDTADGRHVVVDAKRVDNVEGIVRSVLEQAE